MRLRLEHVYELMRKKELSQRKLCEKAGLSTACISRLLSGQREPSTKVISGLLKAFPEETFDTLFFLP